MKKFNKTVKKAVAVCLVLLIAAGCLVTGEIGEIDLNLTASAEVLSGTIPNTYFPSTYEYDTETKVLSVNATNGQGSISRLSSTVPEEVRNNVETIIIGDAVSSITTTTFSDMSNLKTISVDENNTYYSSDEYGILYNKDKTRLDYFPKGNTTTSLTLPSTLTKIDVYAFQKVDTIEYIEFPESLIEIGAYAFEGCKGLKEAIFSEKLETIGDAVFMNCSSLETVHLSDKITVIPSNCFNDSGLKNINFPSKLESIERNAFQGCSLESVKIPATLTSIETPGATFSRVTGPFEADPDNPNYSTDENGALFDKDKTILYCYPDVKTEFTYDINCEIDAYAFAYCHYLTGVTFSKDITEIPSHAFDWTSISEIDIPESVTSIGSYAFSRTNIEEIDIPESVTSIGSYAFSNSTIREITIPDSVTSIGDHLFWGCHSLTDVVLSSEITQIPFMTLFACSNLENVTIGEKVTSIASHAIDNLKNIYFRGTKEQWEAIDIHADNDEEIAAATIHYNYGKTGGMCGDSLTWAFDEVTGELAIDGSGAMYSYDEFDYYEWSNIKDSITSVVINGAENVSKNAFNGCTNLKEVMLGETTASVDDYAFANCDSLTAVTLPYSGNVTVADLAFENHSDKLTLIADAINIETATYAQNNSIVVIPVSYDSEKKILSFGNTFTVYQNTDYYFLNYYILKNSDCEYLHFDKLVFYGVLTDSYEAQEFENLDPDAESLTFVNLYVSIKAIDQSGEHSVSFGEVLEMYESGNYDAFKLVTESDDGKFEETLIQKMIARILLIASKVVNFFRRMFR